MKKKDIDFSDFEAIQAHLQEEGDKPRYKNRQKMNKAKEMLLKGIVIDK